MSMSLDLTPAQQSALQEGGGFVQGESFVLLSRDAYRRMMAVGDDAEWQASLAAIEEGLADAEAGRTKLLDDVIRDLDQKYGP